MTPSDPCGPLFGLGRDGGRSRGPVRLPPPTSHFPGVPDVLPEALDFLLSLGRPTPPSLFVTTHLVAHVFRDSDVATPPLPDPPRPHPRRYVPEWATSSPEVRFLVPLGNSPDFLPLARQTHYKKFPRDVPPTHPGDPFGPSTSPGPYPTTTPDLSGEVRVRRDVDKTRTLPSSEVGGGGGDRGTRDRTPTLCLSPLSYAKGPRERIPTARHSRGRRRSRCRGGRRGEDGAGVDTGGKDDDTGPRSHRT